MTGTGPRIVIADTSVLVSFLRVDAMAMLGRLSKSIVITEHVEAEIAEHYELQRERLLAALKQNFVSQVALTSDGELAMFGLLAAHVVLGPESVPPSHALHRAAICWPLTIAERSRRRSVSRSRYQSSGQRTWW